MSPDIPFNWVDWVIVSVIGLSTLLSLLRGFVKEALSLAAWVLAFFVATAFSAQVSLLLEQSIENDGLRYAVSYGILFVASLMLGSLVNNLVRQLVKMTGLGGLDRVLGTVFGFARGLIIVVVLVYIAQAIVPEEELEQESLLLPRVMLVVEWAQQNFSTLVTDNEGLRA
jgi:membrane protein required for colicin V production